MNLRHALLLLLILVSSAPARANIDLYFTPVNDVEQLWVDTINRANVSIHVACFGISNPNIAAALIMAARFRGVEVILLESREQSQIPSDLHRDIAAAGGRVILKPTTLLLHDKYAVFDWVTTIEGSMNLSRAGPKEDNSCVFFNLEPAYTLRFEADWEDMFSVYAGRPYVPGIGAQLPPVLDLKGKLN